VETFTFSIFIFLLGPLVLISSMPPFEHIHNQGTPFWTLDFVFDIFQM
jgi:hypothetical protein